MQQYTKLNGELNMYCNVQARENVEHFMRISIFYWMVERNCRKLNVHWEINEAFNFMELIWLTCE